MALVWFYVHILGACSLEDLLFVFNSSFKAHASEQKIKEVISVLVGAEILKRDGPLGLVRVADRAIKLAEPSKSYQAKLTELALELTNLMDECCNPNYVEAAAHAN